MSQLRRPGLVLVVLLAGLAGPVAAQTPAVTDRPKLAVPLHAPTRQELDRKEALRLYGRALLQERDSRLIEAVGTLEQAVRLDPESALLRKTLVPLYLALDRLDDALEACRQALDREPGDYETWYLYARQLKAQNRSADAMAALERGAACPELKEHLDLRLQIHFDLGVLREGAQDFDKAASAFREVLTLLEKPDALLELGPFTREDIAHQTAETFERLGRVCVRAQHFAEAVSAYRKAQEKDPSRAARLCYNLADVCVGQGKQEAALQYLNEYLKTQPQGTEAYELKIKLLRQLGRAAEVLPDLEQAAAADNQNSSLKLFLARQCTDAGRLDRAEHLYGELEREAVSPDVYRGLFALYRRQGRDGRGKLLIHLDEAIERAGEKRGPPNPAGGSPAEGAKARAMLTVLREDPALVKDLVPQVRERVFGSPNPLKRDTCLVFAVLAARTNQLDAAEEIYRSCLRNAAAVQRREEHAIYQGLLRVLWQGSKYEDIVEVCRQGLEQASATNRVLFHLDMARALAHLGRMDEAITQAKTAVDIADEDNRFVTRSNYAHLLAQAERFDEAVAECEAMLKDFPTAEEVHDTRHTLSQVYSLAKEPAKAQEQLQLVLKEHPDDAWAKNDLGFMWAEQGKNLEEAEKLIREAIDQDHKQRQGGTHVDADSDLDNAAYIDSLGWVLFQRGKIEEARKELEKAVSLPTGDDPVVWDHLGDVCYRQHETVKARRAWEKAVELYEAVRRRQPDERLKDIKEKLKLLHATQDQR